MGLRRCSLVVVALLVASLCPVCRASGDLYEVFGLTREASQADIKRTYKKLALQLHPDKNPSADAEQRFIAVQKAYEILSDPDKRQRYDARRGFFHALDSEDSSGGSNHPPDFGKGVIFESASDFWAAVNGDDLWLLHVYSDEHENFGSWMVQLADEIKLGHLNVDRGRDFNDVLRDVLGSRRGRWPFLVLCQRGRHHAFKPSFQSVFFGLASAVTREALHFVDYWQGVARFSSDAELKHFLSFRPGGSSRLRLVVVVERPDERRLSAYLASIRLSGQLQVAQISYYDATDMHGRPGPTLGTFRIRHLPAAVLFDPGTGRLDVVSGDRSVESMPDTVGKILEGRPRASQMMAVQEFDVDSHRWRCGADGGSCGWLLILAVPSGVEKQRERLKEVLETFGQACRLLISASYRLPNAACFWLRRGRAPGWDSVLRRLDIERRGSSEALAVALGPGQIAISPDAGGSSRELFSWFKSVAAERGPTSPLKRGDWPPLPPAVSSEEEPVEDMEWEDVLQKFEAAGRSAMDSAIAGVEQLLIVLDRMDGEELALITGIIILCVGAVIALCIFGRGQQSETSEIEALARLTKPWVAVRLKRQEGQKFGIGIAPQNDRGGLSISHVHEGGALDLWNQSQERIERRIRSGDRICCATHTTNGRRIQCDSDVSIAQALREATEVTLMVMLEHDGASSLRRLTGTVILDDLLLRDCLKLASRPDGKGTELEVVRVEPALAARNGAMDAKHACATQRIDVGDLVIAVNGHTRLTEEDLRTPSPAVLVAKWRPQACLKNEPLDVPLVRLSAEDRWGMQLRLRAEDQQQMEVRKVMTGGAVARWNNSESRSGQSMVLPGDILVAVNGQKELSAIAAELKGMQATLTLERWIDSSSTAGCACIPAESRCECKQQDEDGVRTSPTPISKASEPSAVDRSQAIAEDDGWDLDFDFDDHTSRVHSHGQKTDNSKHSSQQESAHVVTRTEEATAEKDGWDVDFDVRDGPARDDVCSLRRECTEQASKLEKIVVTARPNAAPPARLSSVHTSHAERASPIMTAQELPAVAPSHARSPLSSAVASPSAAALHVARQHPCSSETADSPQPRAPPGVGDSWRVPDSGGHWLREARGFLCLLTGPGSPRHVAALAELRAAFLAPSCPVRFFYEARLRPDSVLVAFPRAGRCALLTPGECVGGGTCGAARALLWRSLSGDVLGLPDTLDASSLERYCARRP